MKVSVLGTWNNDFPYTLIDARTIKEEVQDSSEDDIICVDGDEEQNSIWAEARPGTTVRHPRAASETAGGSTRSDTNEEWSPEGGSNTGSGISRRYAIGTRRRRGAAACSLYRQYRERNNEASRRSRENRKLREAVMREECRRLERVVPNMRSRALELERRVAALRQFVYSAVSESPGDGGNLHVSD